MNHHHQRAHGKTAARLLHRVVFPRGFFDGFETRARALLKQQRHTIGKANDARLLIARQITAEGNRRFDIVVRLSEDLREKIDDLKRLPVRVDDGGLLTLGQVADFKVVEQVLGDVPADDRCACAPGASGGPGIFQRFFSR